MSEFLISYQHNGAEAGASITATDWAQAEARLASLMQGAAIIGEAHDALPDDVLKAMLGDTE